MRFSAVLILTATICIALSCRPKVGARVHTAGDEVVQGFFAATDIIEKRDGQTPYYEVTCLNTPETKRYSMEEMMSNTICPAVVASPTPGSERQQTQASGPTSTGTKLVFGEVSWIKADAVDCTASACTIGPAACRVAQQGAQEITVTNVRRSDKRSYDHIQAEITGLPQCPIKQSYIFFPHLDIAVKFTADTPLLGSCTMKSGAVLMGRIEKLSTPARINFRVTRTNGCATSGTVFNFTAETIEKSEIARAILGL